MAQAKVASEAGCLSIAGPGNPFFERSVFHDKRTKTGERRSPRAVKKKKTWPPNGCSPVRWLVIGLLAIVGAFLLSGVADGVCKLLHFPEGSPYGYLPDYLGTMLGFVASFWWTVFLIRKIAKTSLRDFVLGSGGRVDVRNCVTIFLLYSLGFLFEVGRGLVDGSLTLNPVGVIPIAVNFLLSVLPVWMQTSFEELVFRGLLRKSMSFPRQSADWRGNPPVRAETYPFPFRK